MANTHSRSARIGALAIAALLGACTVKDASDKPADTAQAPASTPASSAAAPAGPAVDSATPSAPTASGAASTTASGNLRVEVDLKARQMSLYDGQAKVESHPVAVGSAKWPTQTGEWTIKQVVFNPEWIPPDESWAEERLPRKPGDPKNPLGRAQLVYDPPRTIHGTNQPSSIGQAVSHGSIRMNNAEIVPLARKLMEMTGAGKDEAWYRAADANRTEKRIVDLPRPVPIKVF